MKFVGKLTVAAASVCLAAGAACASDKLVYTYDALGRLTDVGYTAGPGSGAAVTIVLDDADNRNSYTVAGASQSAPAVTSSPVPRVAGKDAASSEATGTSSK